MGAVIFFSIGMLFLLSIPIITSRMARRMGRDPRKWFIAGFLLPVISTAILFCLKDLSDEEKTNV